MRGTCLGLQGDAEVLTGSVLSANDPCFACDKREDKRRKPPTRMTKSGGGPTLSESAWLLDENHARVGTPSVHRCVLRRDFTALAIEDGGIHLPPPSESLRRLFASSVALQAAGSSGKRAGCSRRPHWQGVPGVIAQSPPKSMDSDVGRARPLPLTGAADEGDIASRTCAHAACPNLVCLPFASHAPPYPLPAKTKSMPPPSRSGEDSTNPRAYGVLYAASAGTPSAAFARELCSAAHWALLAPLAVLDHQRDVLAASGFHDIWNSAAGIWNCGSG
ncbi:hypothetical protein NUW54_g3745 [Trametes sanguinea]|uniref:Uncharacterized protein n=1 Tax=Trametes sanguinea TaxID=158606 RepID=A0ACC1Q2P1_9APHY|nr:hypothetical protein NUW54_g3745 [Trametes sanguinea]